jgi:hypothetical protein
MNNVPCARRPKAHSMSAIHRPPARRLPVRRRALTLGLSFLAVLIAPRPEAIASTFEEKVVSAMEADYIHGVTAEIAQREVGVRGVPILLRLLADPAFPRRDNVVAFLSYLGGRKAAGALLDLLRDPPAPVTIPEEDRALLLAPQALGHIAARGHPAARRALLAMTANGAEGGVLSRAAARGPRPDKLRDDLLEMALRGLAYSREEGAVQRILEIAQGTTVPAPRGRALERAAESALGLLESLDSPSASDSSDAAESTGSLRTQLADPGAVTHEHRLDYANHVDHDNPMTDERLDQVLLEGSVRAAYADFADDVACCVRFVRKGTGQTFGSPGDGLDVIDNIMDQLNVEMVNTARFKVVRIINFCGAPGTNILGCAGVGGATATVVRRTNLGSEGILWIHEYGHNVGLVHHGDARYIMNAVNTGNNSVLDANDCDTYHNPNYYTFADMIETGPCSEPAHDNGTCELGEDCGSYPGDCISGIGSAVCGNGVCEAGDGEDCVSCQADCDGLQSVPPPFQAFCCGDGDGENPIPCTDPRCSGGASQCTDVSAAVPFCCGDLTCEGDETPLNCGIDCGPPTLTSWRFYGTAQGGGMIDLIISGVSLHAPTTAGQSAVGVASAVATAINNHATLSSMGVTATSDENEVTTSGSLDHVSSTDPGINTYDVPALSSSGIGVTWLLFAAGLLLRRRRARAR